MEGQQLGSYTIERELGRGGMGAVFTAVHGLLGRRAAVKVLLAELSRNQELVQRFFNEARAATAIKHPSIVEIYDFGWAADGSAYIVMELMDGEPLSARVARLGRLPAAAAVTIARQIANALAAAHRAGIVHRDLKPDNVFLVPDVEVVGGERVKLLDFGIAKLVADGSVSRTTTGAIMGTPLYMAPEQCEGARQVDHRADLYALGCILFEMLAGRPPFQAEGVGALIGAHIHVPPPVLSSVAAGVPPEIDALVARLLAKAPADRPQTADEVAGALASSATLLPMAVAPLPAAHVRPSSLPPSPSTLSAATTAGAPGAAHPPSTLSAASSVAVDAGPATAAAGPTSRRGWLIGGGLLATGAAVAVAVVAAGGGGGSAAVVTAVDAASAAVLDVDAAPLATAIDAGAEAPVPTDAAPPVTLDAAVAPPAIDAGVRPRPRPIDAGVPQPGTGELSPELVRKALERLSGRLRACVPPGGRARLSLRLDIAPDGAVRRVDAGSGDGAIDACAEAMVRTVRFPRSALGNTVTVPLTLQGPPRPPPTTGPIEPPRPPGAY